MASRLVVLAAGAGERLRPLTADRPKCMVPIHGIPILDWILATARRVGVRDVIVVRGYLADRVRPEETTLVDNPRFAETNMVYSLACAADRLTGSVVVSYADIIYEPSVLQAVIDSPHEICVAVDRGWKAYWEQRFENPLDDAESLGTGSDGLLTDIGRKVASINEIAGQYIGLMKFSGAGLARLVKVLDERTVEYGQRPFERMYMTDLLQGLIACGQKVHPVWIDRKWLEVDNLNDLAIAESLLEPFGPGAADGFRITG